MIVLSDSQAKTASALRQQPGQTGADLICAGFDPERIYTDLRRLKARELAEQDGKAWSLTKLGRRSLYATEGARAAWREFPFRTEA